MIKGNAVGIYVNNHNGSLLCSPSGRNTSFLGVSFCGFIGYALLRLEVSITLYDQYPAISRHPSIVGPILDRCWSAQAKYWDGTKNAGKVAGFRMWWSCSPSCSVWFNIGNIRYLIISDVMSLRSGLGHYMQLLAFVYWMETSHLRMAWLILHHTRTHTSTHSPTRMASNRMTLGKIVRCSSTHHSRSKYFLYRHAKSP